MRDHEPLRPRRRVHRRPDGAHLPLGRRRRGGARQRAAAAARARRPTARCALADIEAAIKPDDAHFARSRLLCLENTIGGKVLPLAYLDGGDRARARPRPRHPSRRRAPVQRRGRARRRSPARARSRRRSTASRSASRKGLGAPVGSALVGSREFIARAHRWRKMARRRHAPGRRARRGGAARARPPRRAARRRPRARARGSPKGCRACPA